MCRLPRFSTLLILTLPLLFSLSCLQEPTNIQQAILEEPAQVRSLSLVTPNGGEILYDAQLLVITWASENCSPQLKLELLHEGEPCCVIAEGAENNGSFYWISEAVSGIGDNYSIRITDPINDLTDSSDLPFAISILDVICDLRVIEPATSKQVAVGDTLEIIWDLAGGACGDSVRIELLHENEFFAEISPNTENDNHYDWIVECSSRDSTGYGIRVIDKTSGSSGETNWRLMILGGGWEPEPGNLVLLNPNSDEDYIENSDMSITWTALEPHSDLIRIDLINEGEICHQIAEVPTESGEYIWTVQYFANLTNAYKIRISDDTGLSDESDSSFQIVKEGLRVFVLSPNGGEQWLENSSQTILWETEGVENGLITLELMQGASVCTLIETDLPDSGEYTWSQVLSTGSPSGYRIRVSVLSEEIFDTSDYPFSIVPPCSYTVISPGEGVDLLEGDPCSITWESGSACEGNVDLTLINEAGGSLLIAEDIPDSGSFLWSVEPIGVEVSDYTLCVTNTISSITGCSEIPFTITPICQFIFESPVAGDTWNEGELMQVSWLPGHGCGEYVLLELLCHGELCSIISSQTPNSGSYQWLIDLCGVEENGYQVRITDLETNVSKTTAGVFTLRRGCDLWVLKPGSGIRLVDGTETEIIWNTAGSCCDRVSIELLHNSVTVGVIAEETENSGTFTWEANQHNGLTAGYGVRITDLETETVRISNGTFMIMDPCLIDLTAPNGGEELVVGEEAEITWDQNLSCGTYVQLDLMRNGAVCKSIAAQAENTGSYSWMTTRQGSETSGYQILIIDIFSGSRDTSDVSFEICSPVMISIIPTLNGVQVTSNHSEFAGGLQAIFSDGEGYTIGSPDWMDRQGSVLVLNPGHTGVISMYPTCVQNGDSGILISPDCSSIEVTLEGMAEVDDPLLKMMLSSNRFIHCLWPIPLSTYLRQSTVTIMPSCFDSSRMIKLPLILSDTSAYDRLYGVTSVSYTFHGWVSR